MMKIACLATALLLAASAWAQLPAPNQAGVAMGHLHFKVKDVQAERKFWVEFLGASSAKLGNREVLKLPDLLVLIAQDESAGGTVESVVDHVGVIARDAAGLQAKLRAAGYKIIRENPKTGQSMVVTPSGVIVEISPNPELKTPVANHHIHFYEPDVDAIKAWYVKTFGAIGGKRGPFEAADVPGVNLSFSKADAKRLPTKGRALDHIGFEVKNLEAFCRKLEAQGVKLDAPYRNYPDLGIGVAFLTDPWGTYIELTEGLNKL